MVKPLHRGSASKILVYFSAMGGGGRGLENLAAKLDFYRKLAAKVLAAQPPARDLQANWRAAGAKNRVFAAKT